MASVRYNIIKKALSMFNIEIQESDLTDTNVKHEISLCLLWIDSAYDRVLHSFKWSFLTDVLSIEEVDKSKITNTHGYKFAYTVTDTRDICDLVCVYRAKDRRWQVEYRYYGGIIYTNCQDIQVLANIKIDLESFGSNIPSEFYDLIAYQLAILICPSLAPKDATITQLIGQQYNMANNSLLRNETTSNIKRFSNEEVY